jgi:hypothetical protein
MQNFYLSCSHIIKNTISLLTSIPLYEEVGSFLRFVRLNSVGTPLQSKICLNSYFKRLKGTSPADVK